jgi:hypothetical protein
LILEKYFSSKDHLKGEVLPSSLKGKPRVGLAGFARSQTKKA